jgi:hypothetical protein
MDGLAKSPSVPLRAGLRFNFGAAAYSSVRRNPKFLRPLHGGDERRSPEHGRPAGRPYSQNRRFADFLRVPQYWRGFKVILYYEFLADSIELSSPR